MIHLFLTGQSEDILKGSQITYVTGVEGDDVVSTQVATVTQSGLSQQVTLISQDGTQHVSSHQKPNKLNHIYFSELGLESQVGSQLRKSSNIRHKIWSSACRQCYLS